MRRFRHAKTPTYQLLSEGLASDGRALRGNGSSRKRRRRSVTTARRGGRCRTAAWSAME